MLRKFGVLGVLSALVLVAVLVMVQCSKNPIEQGIGEVTVHLFGSSPGVGDLSGDKAPPIGDVSHIWLTIIEVGAHASDGTWETKEITNGTYDFLTLINGVTEPLDLTLTPGQYTGLRLVIDSINSIVVDGQTYPLKVPSGEQTGVKLSLGFDVVEGEFYEILVDFDIGKSIARAQGGDLYILRPHYNAYKKVLCGTIAGKTMLTDGAGVGSLVEVVDVVDGTKGTSTISDETTGAYKVYAPAGSYNVHAKKQAAPPDTVTVVSEEKEVLVQEEQEVQCDLKF